MSWQQSRPENVATISYLEERINMYISAMDTASAVNDSHQSLQLQRDIQKLVDLMERVGAGEEIMESQVPPPLAITPQIDVLPNALGELSARLAEYHKALYFAEEELSDDRINKIQGMQHALQVIHNLQKRAEAGFPIRADEVPPPISIPSDDEFDNDAINTISRRLNQYQVALKAAEQSESTDRRRIPKIQSTIRTLEFLMTRAKSKRPVWKKDIPPEFEYCSVSPKGSPSMNKTKYLLVIRSLILRLSAPTVIDSDVSETAATALKKLKTLEEELVKQKDAQPWLRSGNSLPELTKEVENLEKLAAKKKEILPDVSYDLSILETRIREYTAAALKAKKDNEMSTSIKHIKVLKGLQALRKSLEKGEAVDMTLVPPAPKDYTPTRESPPIQTQVNEASGLSRSSQDETARLSFPQEVPRSSQNETARLPPVNMSSSPETEKYKLAERLTNYLSCEDEPSAEEASQSNVVVNKMTKSTTKLLKKVQNSAVKLPAEKVLYGDPGFSDESIKEGTKQKELDVVQSLIRPEKEKQKTAMDNVEAENSPQKGIVNDYVESIDVPSENSEHATSLDNDEGEKKGKQHLESESESDMVESKSERNMVESKSESHTVESKTESHTVESKTESNTMESKSESNTVESKTESNTVESKYESNTVESKTESNTVESKSESNTVEPKSESNTVESKSESNTVDSKSEISIEKEETAESAPKTSPKSSGDIYSRKTLDSVGFLSCQTVSEDTNKKLNGVLNITRDEKRNNRNFEDANGVENPVCDNHEQLGKNSKPLVSEPGSVNHTEITSVALAAPESQPMREGPVSKNHLQNDPKIHENQFELEQTAIKTPEAGTTTHQSVFVDSNSLEDGRSAIETDMGTKSLPNGHGSDNSLVSSQNASLSSLSQPLNASSKINDQTENQATFLQTNQLDPGYVDGKEGATSIGISQQQTTDMPAAQKDVTAITQTIPTSCSSEELEFQDLMASMSASPASTIKAADGGINASSDIPEAAANQVQDQRPIESAVQKEESINSNYQEVLNSFKMNGSYTNSSDVVSLNAADGHVLPPSHNINGLSTSFMKTDFSSEQHFMSLPTNSTTMAAKYHGSQTE
ncbi:coiled-coil and C2 domain-containing protein 1A [Elysia marginata]|uniref:Coiled-coil and C2 domain-containing protein 1A n=1 Tax=Elysia marginata TaxID=1093978 RepID=A0AAV4HUS2_9GAST|nr:coiled-coil and C2 domain-containing protein 1A [Elysia marginata]